MEIIETEIPGVLIVEPKRFGDERGFFSEVYNERAFAEAGIAEQFVQDNHSLSVPAHTVRGLHFQAPPAEQAKLVRVARGRVLDVAVDIRVGSPSYGRSVAVELSADNWRQLFVPAGFAHGFCTLEANSEVLYKVSGFYSAEHDMGIYWHDDALDIAWPCSEAEAVVSEKDRNWPRLADFDSPFRYRG